MDFTVTVLITVIGSCVAAGLFFWLADKLNDRWQRDADRKRYGRDD